MTTNNGSSPELPGVPRSPQTGDAPRVPAAERKSQGLIVGLVVVIAILLVALVVALLRPWESGSSAGAETAESAAASATSHDAATTAAADAFQVAEEQLATERGWVAGEDYMPSQAQAARQLIASIPSYEEAGLSIGSSDAAVTVRILGDFSCPVCAQLHASAGATFESLAQEGDIQLDWLNFVIFDADYQSSLPANGAVAAGQQGLGWEFVDAAYNSVAEGEHPTWTTEMVTDLASQIGVPDMDTFAADLSSDATTTVVNDQSTMAQQLGFTGTPVVLINGVYFGGFYPLETMENTIALQAELAAQGYDWAS